MAAALVFILIMMAVVCVFYFTVYALFLLTIFRTQRQVRPELRKISPGAIWICLIPIVGFLFAIWMVYAVSISLRRQFNELDEVDRDSSYGLVPGFLCLFTFIGSYVVAMIGIQLEFEDYASVICNVLFLISFVSWIVYWVQISNYGRRLRTLKHVDYSPEELDFDDELRPDSDLN